MKIAVVAANGKAGKLIVKEAVNRGMDVTAIVRGDNKTVAPKAMEKDLFDLTSEDLKGFDAVVDVGTYGVDARLIIYSIAIASKRIVRIEFVGDQEEVSAKFLDFLKAEGDIFGCPCLDEGG